MAYRNGTYIAFHAEGKTDPTASDIKYYRLVKAWHEATKIEFKFVNSHDKVAAVKDSASRAQIMKSLKERLDNSRNMVLIIGKKTRLDTDFVPFEIRYAIDVCKIPVIATYTDYSSILHPSNHRNEWPQELTDRIDSKDAEVLHIPFKKEVILAAIGSFDHNNLPGGQYTHYTKDAQKGMGVLFKD